jgi:hypothetical protein
MNRRNALAGWMGMLDPQSGQPYTPPDRQPQQAQPQPWQARAQPDTQPWGMNELSRLLGGPSPRPPPNLSPSRGPGMQTGPSEYLQSYFGNPNGTQRDEFDEIESEADWMRRRNRQGRY